MKKLKNFWKNNRILMILGIILVVCIIAILVVVLKYFVGSHDSVYGSRFDNMKTVIKDKEKDAYIAAIEANSGVTGTRFRVSHKTLYISVSFKDDVTLEDAKKVIETSLDSFSDDIKLTYDINFTIKGKNMNNGVMGARNAAGNGISWSNNTQIEEATK